jgi:TPR repeat protein
MPEKSREDAESPLTAEAIAFIADFAGGDSVRVKRLSQLVLEFADSAGSKGDPAGAADLAKAPLSETAAEEKPQVAPPLHHRRTIRALASGILLCLTIGGFLLVGGKPEPDAGTEPLPGVIGKTPPAAEDASASALIGPPPQAEAAPWRDSIPPTADEPPAAEIPEPNPAAAAAPASIPAMQVVEPGASDAELAAVVARGDAFTQVRDIASARLFYERAAEAGNGRGALRMGESLDPAFLDRAGIRGAQGNQQQALSWYLRARDLGDAEAERLLKKFEPQ